MIQKLAVVGGSSSNVSELFLALHEFQLPVGEVCLIGRRAQSLDPVAAFCCRLCQELGYPTRVTQSLDLRAGLQDASFVVNQIKVGGKEVWERVNHIMDAFGFRGHARTLGAAVTNLPVVLKIGRAVTEVCPDAILIQFTNPCGIHAEALARHVPQLKTLSGCPMPNAQRGRVAQLLGQDIDPFGIGGIEIDWIGFNHCAWIGEVTLDGQSVMNEVMERNARLEKPLFRVDLAEEFGCLWGMDAPMLVDEVPLPRDDAEARARAFVAGGDVGQTQPDLTPTGEAASAREVMSRRKPVGWYHQCMVPVLRGLSSGQSCRYYTSVLARDAAPDFPGLTVEAPVTLSREA